MKAFVVAMGALVAADPAAAAPLAASDVCYVRLGLDEPAPAASAAAAPAQSFVGVRRRTEQLFDLDISVAGPDLATCSLAGVAKLRGESGAELLAMVVRPDPSRKSGRSGTLCQVFVEFTPSAVELRTTPTSCQAQALCGGRVELNGQRFEHTSKLPSGVKGPCFGGKRVP